MFGLILLYRLLFDIISFDVAAVLFLFSFIADDEEKSAIDPIRDTKMCRDAARALFYLALGPDKTSSSSYQTPDFVLTVLFTTTFIPQPPPSFLLSLPHPFTPLLFFQRQCHQSHGPVESI